MSAAPLDRAFGHPLSLARAPLCPEIALWLLDGQVDLERACRDLDACQPPPYWAFCWGAGQALARFVLDRPELVRGQHVIDYGSGCGIVAIAAALSGAEAVTAVDSDPAARAATARNASQNGVQITATPRLPVAAGLLLAADVLYEPGQLAWLLGERDRGRRVILADPGRASSPEPGVPALARYDVRTLPDVDSPMRTAAVFEL